MPFLVPLEPVDYVVIGHLSCDMTSEGPRLGGTAAYAALTAKALGLRVGVVTSWGGEISLEPLTGMRVVTVPAEHSTSFQNTFTPTGRVQVLRYVGGELLFEHIPEAWRQAPIVHLGPIAQEAKSLVDARLASSLFGLTPQGWFRSWDESGRVQPCAWPEAGAILPKVGAAVISIEDVGGDENQIEAMATSCRVLAVTEGPSGARLYWNGDLRRFNAPSRREVDATGAGDVFAAAFFYRLFSTRDPWASARFATQLASFSVTRPGLEGIPNADEIRSCMVEVL